MQCYSILTTAFTHRYASHVGMVTLSGNSHNLFSHSILPKCSAYSDFSNAPLMTFDKYFFKGVHIFKLFEQYGYVFKGFIDKGRLSTWGSAF